MNHRLPSPSRWVVRPQVLDRFWTSAKLVLVRAPAGFGKTTAMQHARQQRDAQGHANGWLTLEHSDNDAVRFLQRMVHALTRMGVELPANVNAVDLVEHLSRHDANFVLWLDDFENLHDPTVLASVREIIGRLPEGGRLVIGSRSLPDLGLGRLRARGLLHEIDTEHLRFSLQEVEAFFRHRQTFTMSVDQLAMLHRKTEGWAAALWLAAIAMERPGLGGDFLQQFSGTHRAVSDYLAEDVLAHQPEDVRDFLIKTSILRHVSQAACQALLPRADVARILRHLDTGNLFITPVPELEHTWRYHSLFSDFLRARLRQEQPEQLARLHLAAAGWYEAQHRPVPAIEHAIEGEDFPHALHLLDLHAESFLEQGRMRLLDRWFRALPAAALAGRPLMQVIAIWAALFTHGPARAQALLEHSECAHSPDAAVSAHVNALRPMLLAMQDCEDEAQIVGHLGLGRVPSVRPFADSLLMNVMAHVLSVLGQDSEAQRLLDAARHSRAGSAFNRMYGESIAGALDLSHGRLRQATARFRLAVSGSAQTAAYLHSHGNAWAGVLYTSAVYESGDMEAADRLINVYLPLARDVGLPDHTIASYRMRARIAFEHGDIDTSFRALTELEYLGHERHLRRVVLSAKLERARLLLLQGHVPAARDELRRAHDPSIWDCVRQRRHQANDIEDWQLGQWRLALHEGCTLADVQAMLHEHQLAAQGGRHLRALKLALFVALGQWQLGHTAQAQSCATECLEHLAREGFVRLVLDEGHLLEPVILLIYHALVGPEHSSQSQPILQEFVQRLMQQRAMDPQKLQPQTQPQPLASSAAVAQENLTAKELRVLQLLAEGYSNSAMAEKLFVSDSTVRTHLRSINAKLGAKSRTQALVIARKLRWIR